MVVINVPIKKTDIPCRQCCNIHETQRQSKYIANRCNEDEMKACPIWQYRDPARVCLTWLDYQGLGEI